jgi:hypothetical protein
VRKAQVDNVATSVGAGGDCIDGVVIDVVLFEVETQAMDHDGFVAQS